VEFNHRLDRAGYRCFFTPKVRVRYYPRSTLGGLFRQLCRYGQGRIRLLRKHPDTFRLPALIPAAFLLGVIAGPAAGLISPWLGVAYAAVLGLYTLAVLLGSLAVAVKAREARLLPLLPLVFLTIHFGAGAGILQEVLLGRESCFRLTRFLQRAQRVRRAFPFLSFGGKEG
jgi:hypothetical protein